MVGIRGKPARLVFENGLLLQSRVKRVKACRIDTFGAVIILAVRSHRKIERRKVGPAKGQRNSNPDCCQPKSHGYSNRQAPQDCFTSHVH
jgi:hypothetical protein